LTYEELQLQRAISVKKWIEINSSNDWVQSFGKMILARLAPPVNDNFRR
jgi:hypothetical protein